MIKRTTKLKNNKPRATITKAAPINTVETVKTESHSVQSVLPTLAAPVPEQRPIVQKPVSPAAHLELFKPEAKSVCVAGSFNGWSPIQTPLTRSNDGKWVGDLTGISGRHEYLFVVDGQWVPDPNARESVQNPFGGRNSVLVVSE